jgi:amino-acid N-acetyltransferase
MSKERKAAMPDIPAMLELINGYASQGIMLPRTEFEMAESIRDFTVIEENEKVVACGALHFYTPTTGEIRSIAVADEIKGGGVGRKLVTALETEAQECELESVFAFTYVPEFFRKIGYHDVDRAELPLKAWKDCMRCPKFQCCDEVAMIRRFGKQARQRPAASLPPEEAALIQLPVIRS